MNPSQVTKTHQTVTRTASSKQSTPQKAREPTCNKMGYTYHKTGVPEQTWVSSLSHSDLPLLDVGACYGVQTIYALKRLRDVIAIDACEQHIVELRHRVAKLNHISIGNLVTSIVSTIPDADILADASVAGILCSEVIHFLKPGDLGQLFSHFFRWLAPGGKLVVTAASWPPRINTLVEKGMMLCNGRSVEEVLLLLKNRPASEIVEAAPGFMRLPDDVVANSMFGEFLYLLSTEELMELAESSGFLVEEVRYYDSEKCGADREVSDSETVLLVAKRPCAAG